MTFASLWRHRRRSNFLAAAWVKDWIKRLITAPALLRSLMLQRTIVAAGGAVGNLSFLAPSVYNGSKSLLKIGDHSFVGRVVFHLHAPLSIGSNVVVNDGAVFFTASHRVDTQYWESFAKPIVVDDYAWIASNAIILPGVTVGRGAVVGAGAVVSRDVPAYVVVAGNPARPVGKNRPLDLCYDPVISISFVEAWLGH